MQQQRRHPVRGSLPAHLIIPLLVLLGFSLFSGCLELIRRPVANGTQDHAQLVGNPDEEGDVKKADTMFESPAADPGHPESQATPDDLPPVSDPLGADPATARKAGAIVVSAGRTGGERDGIKKVNEYVLWCIKQGMWSEAQHHLEQSLQKDSLAASVHNNLGIIYERLGERENAAAAYARASALDDDNEVYKMNLQLLRQGARFDPADTLATDASDDDALDSGQEPDSRPAGLD
jgi:tetratricopeptide (TPR) repeat protein